MADPIDPNKAVDVLSAAARMFEAQTGLAGNTTGPRCVAQKKGVGQ